MADNSSGGGGGGGEDDENAWFYTAQLDAFELYHIVQEDTKPSGTPLAHATSGAIGSAMANLLVYPLDLCVTRVQVAARRTERSNESSASAEDSDEYNSILSALGSIYTHEGGLSALYSGVGDSLLKSVLDSFLFFLAYNFARQARQSMLGLERKRSLPVLEEIGVGMLAGAAAKLCTTPVQNVVTRKQTAAMKAAARARARHQNGGADDDGKQGKNRGPSARAIAAQMYRDKGWTGFWAGYSASLILTVNPALTFLLQNMLLRLLVPRERRKSPGARLTFLMAAASKAVASTITYPVSVAKTRAQAGWGGKDDGEKDEGGRQPNGRRRARTTILGAIVAIARREGAAGLYRGLGGEVLKGFFTHGLTMLMKERIHVGVIQLYGLMLKTLSRLPPNASGQSVGEGAGEAAHGVKEAADEAKELVGDAVESAKEGEGEGEGEGVVDMVQRGTNQVREALGWQGKGATAEDKKEK